MTLQWMRLPRKLWAGDEVTADYLQIAQGRAHFYAVSQVPSTGQWRASTTVIGGPNVGDPIVLELCDTEEQAKACVQAFEESLDE
jgi:hypothetical protein